MNQPVTCSAGPGQHGTPRPPAPPGHRLRELRTRQPSPLPLDGLAEQAGYTKGYLSKIESGKKPLTTEVARACDRVLHTGGVLPRLVRDAAAEAASAVGRCRYPGLATFEVADAAWFFGRERVSAVLVSRPAVTLQEGGLPAPTSPLCCAPTWSRRPARGRLAPLARSRA
ncbi:helix-turn-helix transcriptional regulator [Streptomyces lincolnensis]|uniref:helix-turn-helix domain-containing protein n=1 Tax=Streptomyces lincolnensis TaxID=1915 RepID=UPI001E6414EB|nr:helix-turn-helix transcriptional regulator [Streptomyces lincolnensis]MCD7445199.1 helix-turn-helix transcriptional regulator [Streptomyces lincolnensis]